MPMYSYKCRDCGIAFDIRQDFSDDSLTVCPECGGSLRKLFDSVGVTFKGSGFYRTDSRSEGRSGGGDSGKDPAKGSGTSADKGAASSGGTSGSGASSKSSSSAGASTGSKP